MAPPSVTSATNLPGAILFLNVTHADAVNNSLGKSNTLVAYDPEIKDKDTFSSLLKRWKENTLPYRERFTEPKQGQENVASFGSTDYYSGVFGKNKSSLSPAWPYKDDFVVKDGVTTDGIMRNGIEISFWNQNATQRGMFTNAAGQLFTSASKANIMTLNSGNKKELLTGGITVDHVKSITLEFYAMQNNGKIDFTK